MNTQTSTRVSAPPPAPTAVATLPVRRRTRRGRGRRAAVTIVTFLVIVWSVLPFLWLVRSSLSPVTELTRVPPAWWPDTVTLDYYADLLAALVNPADATTTVRVIALGFQNSLIVCAAVTLLNVVLGFTAAYGFSRSKSKILGAVLNSLIITRMIPAFAIIIPLFLLFSRIHLYDTFTGLILAELSATLPFSIWIIKGYLDTIGSELDEQARIDGASRLQTVYHVMLPVARPAVATAAIFTFLLAWNSFLFPLVLSSSPEVMTVQPQIAATYGDMRADYGILFASTVLVSAPPILVAIALQRHIVNGLMSGSVRG